MNKSLLDIDYFIENEFADNGKDYVAHLSLLIQEYFQISEQHRSADFLFSKENEQKYKRFIAFCFIRVLGSPNSEKINNYKHQILKQILEALPDVCSMLEINEKTETYKKELVLREYIKTRNSDLAALLSFKGDIENIKTFQQTFRRAITAKKNSIVEFFLSDLVGKPKLDEIFNGINDFVDEEEDTRYNKYQQFKVIIEAYVAALADNGSRYAREILIPTFTAIEQVLDKEMQTSPYSLKSYLILSPTEKKYPLQKGSRNTFNISITNNGPGFARNVKLEITKYDSNSVEIAESEQYLGTLKIESSIVEFNYKSKVDSKEVAIEIKVSIEHSRNSKAYITRTLTFQAQTQNIDWDVIRYNEPYNLEPVETDHDLIGRESILQRLRNMINKPLGSAYIYGQRRVGKTSIVKTLQNSISDRKVQILYIEAGDWNDANSAFNSMESLAFKICKKISKFDNKFSHLPIPTFNGSFSKITEYLDDVIEIDKDYKLLIILDEFDRISSDLYERGEIGKSFVLSLRSISNRPQVGITLVGGEKLEYILSQWQEFNKFSPIRVDYFSKERDWEDFRKLIKNPVENFLEITDSAITTIFDETSGNPYFTKKICMEIYSQMVENRDVHVTRREAVRAIRNTRSSANIGATDFSHFWEDGIKGKVAKEEETSLKRRKVLILIAQVLAGGNIATKQRIIDFGTEFGIKSLDIEKYLLEFEQRRIIYFENEQLIFVVNFFKEWLISGGKEKIIATFEEEERVFINQQIEESNKVKSDEIAELISNWNVYKGKVITIHDIRNWLDQFDDVFDQRMVFKLLKNFKLYSESEIRTKLSSIFNHARKQLSASGNIRVIDNSRSKKRDEFLLSNLDRSPAKGASYFTKLFADENAIYSENVCYPEQIEKRITEKASIRSLILIDDFIGSGDTIIKNFQNYFSDSLIELIKSRNINIVIGVIAGYLPSKEKIESKLSSFDLTLSIQIADILSEDDKCFSLRSAIFETPIETKRAQELCRYLGEKLEPKTPLGYSDSQALIAFPMNCPNNTLPIFWKKTSGWHPLFERN